MKVTMKYNPYKVETQILLEDENIMESTKFSAKKNERLQVWIEKLFPMLVDEINDDIFDFEFMGTIPDFEDIQLYASKYPNVTVTHIQVEEVDDKFSRLEELVKKMKEGPFEQLRDDRIEANFQKALNSEFEIAVIATMSSGKSTLINAILGKELMPSKNEACTAKVSRIKNNPNIENYSAIAIDKDGEEFKTIKNATVEDFAEFNDDPKIHLIEIEGHIPKIKSGKMNLVLVDTPGPNNSMDASHRQHTLSVIKSDDKPMVLYVLNATQLRTDDDLALLNTVAEAMGVGGKQSKDRFIFAMNKADAFDPEKGESIEGAIENVREYLEQQNIENPNIYPLSSQVAKVIRKKQNNIDLTRSEKGTLNGIDLFIEEPSMHLNQYAPISPSLKRTIEEDILANNDNEYIPALHYTGITSVEAAINEYLEKYAVTSKITNAVNTFQRIIEQEDMQNNIERTILEDSNQREEIKKIMESITTELEKGDKAAEFKKKIKNMDVSMNQFFSEVNKKTFKRLAEIPNKLRGKVKKYEAERILFNIQTDVMHLQDQLVTDLEKNISTTLRSKAESYVTEYQTYINGITSFESKSIKLSNWNKAIISTDINVNNLLENYSNTEQVVVGTKTVANPDRKWFTFWRSKYVERNIYEDVEYVDLTAIKDELFTIEETVDKNIKDAMEFTEKELLKLKKFFISEIERLEKIMKKRVNDIKDLAEKSNNIEEQLKIHLEKRSWLEKFISELDDVLELKEKAGVLSE